MIETSNVKNNAQFIESLYQALENYDLTLVTFTTKAGTERVMGCTRKLSAIPENNRDDIDDPKLNNELIVAIYDFQNSGWRSFRKDSVTSFEVQY